VSSTRRTNTKRRKSTAKTDQFSLVNVLSHKAFHYLILILFAAGSFVFVRMKTLEVRYKVSKVQKTFRKIEDENKILKAKKAELLAPNRMRKLANEFDLHTPKEEQVIVIK